MTLKIFEKAITKYKEERKIFKEFPMPESLPVVDQFCESRLDKDIFSNTNILFIQHFLSPLILRIKAMEKYGACDLDRCWFVDIPYSTNRDVRNKLMQICDKEKFATEFNDALAKYSPAQRERVIDVLEKISNANNDDLLIIDDGAYVIRTLVYLEEKNPEFVKKFLHKRKISIVEQTTRGHRYFFEKSSKELLFLIIHNISLVSIAKSLTKTYSESPFIGVSVSYAITNKLQEIRKNNNKTFKNILIMGYGPVGESTANAIKKSKLAETIDISEKDESLFDKIRDNGFNPRPTLDSEEYFTSKNISYDAIFGCTGYRSFHPKDVHLLASDAVLASGSSATVEFNRSNFIDKFNEPTDEFKIENKSDIELKGIHSNITVNKNGNSFTFLNAGFPVNFDGKSECIPFWGIQMTHALLIAAAQQTLKMQSGGFTELNLIDDTWLYGRTLSYLSEYLEH